MLRRVALYFFIATCLCLLFSCTSHRALEKSLIKYFSWQGLDVAAVEISKGNTEDSYVCVVPISGLINNYTVEEIWDVTFKGKKVRTASRRAVTDSTCIRAVNLGSEYSLGEYIEKVYFPKLADPSYQGAPYVDSLLQDEDFYLRHREAWLSTVPIGDRAIYQVRGPVKTLVTNIILTYGRDHEYKEIGFNVDGVRFGYYNTELPYRRKDNEYRDGKAVYCILWKSKFYDDVGGDLCWAVEAVGGIQYNEKGLVTYYRDDSYSTEDGQGGPGTLISYRLFYDQLGNCIKKKSIYYEEYNGEYSYSYEKYKILKTDRLGNWTERRLPDGEVEKRTIVYYTPNEMGVISD